MTKEKEFVFMKIKSGCYSRINFDDILYIDAEGDYSSIFTKDQKLMLHLTLKRIEEILPDNFFRCHRSYIVNLNHVTKIEDSILYVGNKKLACGDAIRIRLFEKLNYIKTNYEEENETKGREDI